MSDLASVLNEQSLINSQPVIRCVKTKKELKIQAAVSEEFYFVRLPLHKISLTASSRRCGNMVVIDRNDLKIGRTVSGFVPKVRIIAGHDLVTEMKAKGDLFVDVWAGRDAISKLHLMSADSVSFSEVQQKLQLLLSSRHNKVNKELSCSAGPWIKEIHPTQHYVVFDNGGNTYKQTYEVRASGAIGLVGKPVKALNRSSAMTEGIKLSSALQIESAAAIPVASSVVGTQYYTTTALQEQSFDTINDGSKPLGMNPGTGKVDADTIVSFGAPSSENANPVLRTMFNIEEALRLYLAQIASGTHVPLPPMLNASGISITRYPNEYREAEIAARAAGANISVLDFLYWQNKQLTAESKLKDGYFASAYAYVGDENDISTWHCTCNTAEAIKQSLETLKASYVPASERGNVEKKLEVAARKFSTDKRDKMAKEGTAEKDGSYPIANAKDLGNAVKDFHRASGSPADKAHIQKRAKALKLDDPFKEVSSALGDCTVPGGTARVAADAEMMNRQVASKKKIKADMAMPMPTANVTQQKSVSAGNPNSGKRKFSIGDRVETKNGKGRITDNESSKDHVEVQHIDGKVKVYHKSDVKKAGK